MALSSLGSTGDKGTLRLLNARSVIDSHESDLVMNNHFVNIVSSYITTIYRPILFQFLSRVQRKISVDTLPRTIILKTLSRCAIFTPGKLIPYIICHELTSTAGTNAVVWRPPSKTSQFVAQPSTITNPARKNERYRTYPVTAVNPAPAGTVSKNSKT